MRNLRISADIPRQLSRRWVIERRGPRVLEYLGGDLLRVRPRWRNLTYELFNQACKSTGWP
jgi:hypothetical protein